MGFLIEIVFGYYALTLSGIQSGSIANPGLAIAFVIYALAFTWYMEKFDDDSWDRNCDGCIKVLSILIYPLQRLISILLVLGVIVTLAIIA